MTAPLSAAVASLYSQIGFVPHDGQIQILGSDKRFMVVTGGEQGGKSMTAAMLLIKRWYEQYGEVGEKDLPLLYWLVGADYDKTTEEFRYNKDALVTLFGESRVKGTEKVDPGYIELRETPRGKAVLRVETKSSGKDPRGLAKTAPNGIIACEPGQLGLVTYERLQGRVGPNRGWLLLPGTLEGSLGWFPMLADAWASGVDDKQSFELPSWDNLDKYPGGRNDPEILRIERENSDEYFMERIAGKRVPPAGLVFYEFRPDIHIQEHSWIPDDTVYIWEDPGYGSSPHAIEVAQEVTDYAPDGTPFRQIRVFEEIYVQGLITTEIIDICKARPWWRSERVLVSDPHYKDQHHSNTSVAEIWMAETGLVAGGERVRIHDGNERLKSFLKPDPVTGCPRITFSIKCQGILSEFGAAGFPIKGPYLGQTLAYRWKTDREGNVVGTVPEDKYNHGVSAVKNGLVAMFGYTMRGDNSHFKVVRW